MAQIDVRTALTRARKTYAVTRQEEARVKSQVTVHLSEVLGRHRIKQTELAKAGGLRLATVNALYHNKTDTVSKLVLARVLTGLRHLSGVEYTVADLIRFEPKVDVVSPQHKGGS